MVPRAVPVLPDGTGVSGMNSAWYNTMGSFKGAKDPEARFIEGEVDASNVPPTYHAADGHSGHLKFTP